MPTKWLEITPLRSITARVGIPLARYCWATVPSESRSAVKVNLFWRRKSPAVAAVSRTFTASTTRPLARYARCSFWMVGISRRHGPHQLAQKSISTTLPLNSDSLPDRSLSAKSIIGLPLRSAALGRCGPKRSTSCAPSGAANTNSESGSGWSTRTMSNVVVMRISWNVVPAAALSPRSTDTSRSTRCRACSIHMEPPASRRPASAPPAMES